MSFAATLSESERRKSSNNAIWSAIYGCISEQFIDSNTIVILYLMLLGGSASFSLFSSAISSFAHAFSSIPFAYLIAHIGLRKSYSVSVYAGIAMFLLMAMAPYMGGWGKYVVILSSLAYSMTRPLYSATWYPILNNFLRPQDRVPFFSRMRVLYMLFNTILIFGLGKLFGKNPPVWLMQAAIAFAGVTLLGRKIYLDKLPIDPNAKREVVHFPSSLFALRKSPKLIGFCCLIFYLDLFVLAVIPVATIYMKVGLGIGASVIMYATSCNLAGVILGNALASPIVKYFGLFKFQVLTHLNGLLVIGLLLFVHEGNPANLPLLFAAFLLNGITQAALMCLGSTRQLSLGQPDNAVISMAFVTSMQNLGTFIGRSGVTLVLASGALAPFWTKHGITFTHYHSIFLCCFIMTAIGLIFQLLATAEPGETKG
ncbi:MAG: hypothetical protein IKR81_07525 [Victivallales bacterium]|nr:hypothetical protein [Victivallales bacterium]